MDNNILQWLTIITKATKYFNKDNSPNQNNKMEKLRVNRFNEKIAEVMYFIIEPRLNLVYAVVGETETELNYYHVCIAPFWSDFENTTVYQLAANPNGERYDTGEPSTIRKELLMQGIFASKLDITKSKEDVYSLLTGKSKKAIVTNVIG